jgi:hypothetical protein
MNLKEAFDIILQQEGLKDLPVNSTERYPLLVEAWKLFKETQGNITLNQNSKQDHLEVA